MPMRVDDWRAADVLAGAGRRYNSAPKTDGAPVVLRLPDNAIPRSAPDKRLWTNLGGASGGLALAALGQAHDGLIVVITDDFDLAHRIESEIAFFLDGDASLPVLQMPDWETLPYDVFSPHQDIVSERLAALAQLPKLTRGILVIPVTTAMHRLPPQSHVVANSLSLKVGQRFDAQRMRALFEQAGYRAVDTVYDHGEFAIRGAIVDLYPMGRELPIRIELFDDDIDSLRTFDPETQRTQEKLDVIEMLPAREFPLDEAAIKAFKKRWHERFDVDHKRCPVYVDVGQGIASPGLEYYLPLFFDGCATLFDYLPGTALVVTTREVEGRCQQFWHEIESRYDQRHVDKQRPLLLPGEMFVPMDELFGRIKQHARIVISSNADEDVSWQTAFDFAAPPALPIDARAEDPASAIKRHIASGQRVLFCSESAGRREALMELLSNNGIKAMAVDGWNDFVTGNERIAITAADLERGLEWPAQNLSIITEPQLYGGRVMQRRRRGKSGDQGEAVFKNLTELRIGSPVVHIEHGVGRYRGLEMITVDGQTNEFLTLEYADDARLYVPVSSLHLISRFTGADEALAPLHKLGSDQWQKAKQKAAEQVRDVAAELLDIYARRAARKGHAFGFDQNAYEQFAAGFPFEETADQQLAIRCVIDDMCAKKPMDRLVCGDVGFGKTEVAMRAAFVAVNAGRQVAVLVPTTLLAQQHFETFRDRFADWPVRVEVMSRFKSAKEQQQAIEGLQQGKIDIIIGTHKLLQSGIRFSDLGLVIIDEEHRFGVQQKEALKALRSEVDILTLTATPIPRTLNMSMTGMRDLSVIATPPARRLSVKTFVRPYDAALVKEAVLREILRGGQVYFLHNDVKTIEKCAEDLRQLIPEARVGIGHGQMRERELEHVMSDFYHKRYNVLVCSTIIETGIDVPNANTIIIERADKFGLAQLHQLRGRVGRSHHQAYAYLLTPDPKSLTADATKRLEAIAEASALGSGFLLATHDLEIRGAGELLGEDQSGQIQSIGFTLYMQMLDRAVKAIRAGKTPNIADPLPTGTEINLRIPAIIPDDYLPDVHARLILYKRIANAEHADALKDLQVEMIDRFGLLPDSTKNLFRITGLKLVSQELGIRKIDAGPAGGRIEFGPDTTVEPMNLVKLVQTQPRQYKLDGANTLRFTLPLDDSEARFKCVQSLLTQLGGRTA